MSQAVNQAMPSTDIEAAHIRHMLAEAVDSVQAPDAENGTVAGKHLIKGAKENLHLSRCQPHQAW